MRVDLSNGRWADLRDTRTRGDRIAAKDAISIHTDRDGGRDYSAALDDRALGVLVTRMIVAWSPELGPMPSQCANPIDALDQLSDDDAEALENAVRPHYDAILGRSGGPDPKPEPAPTVISGNVLSTSTPGGAAPPAPSTNASSNGTGTPAPSLGLPPR